MKVNFDKFSNPLMGKATTELYTALYGEAGDRFLQILSDAPEENAVISMLVAYLAKKKGELTHGYEENC